MTGEVLCKQEYSRMGELRAGGSPCALEAFVLGDQVRLGKEKAQLFGGQD